MTTDFDNFVSAALDAFYKGDFLPTLTLADYLDDCGDERAKRLRLRFKSVQHQLEHWRPTVKYWEAQVKENGAPIQCLDSVEFCVSRIITEWVSYFIRLMSVKPGERVPRVRATVSGYGSAQPVM